MTWTVLRLLRWSGEYLESKGVEAGRRDAEHLLAHALGWSRLDLYLQFDRPLSEEELGTYKPLLLRRAGREPLQYVLGRASFRELELRVDPRALIPRPETEVLVDAVLAWATERVTDSAELSALDLGTGSGAIALSLGHEGPFGHIVATDASPEALDLARENRDAAGLAARVELREGRLYEPVRGGERFDVIVSNPPYVSEEARDDLEPEVRDWEPAKALFAGPDGLDVLVPLVREAPAHLCPGGLLALEVSPDQIATMEGVVNDTRRYERPAVRNDWAGRQRILLALRR